MIIIVVFLKGVQLAETKSKFSQTNLFYKYLTQKHKMFTHKKTANKTTKIKKQVL